MKFQFGFRGFRWSYVSVALVLIRLGGSGLAFYKEHVALFQPVLPHPGSELSAIFFVAFLILR